jgi:hypothetical protein
LIVEFPGDRNGAYILKKDTYSILKSQYRANADGIYSRFVKKGDGACGPAYIVIGGDDYMIFRVRSRMDKNGKIISANYGKIYGPLDYFVMERDKLRLVYYFNPKANDTNLEFDGKGWGENWGR